MKQKTKERILLAAMIVCVAILAVSCIVGINQGEYVQAALGLIVMSVLIWLYCRSSRQMSWLLEAISSFQELTDKQLEELIKLRNECAAKVDEIERYKQVVENYEEIFRSQQEAPSTMVYPIEEAKEDSSSSSSDADSSSSSSDEGSSDGSSSSE